MGLINPNLYSEIPTLASMYQESASALGTECKYHELVNTDQSPQKDIHRDPKREYKSAKVINVIFEQSKSSMRGKNISPDSSESPKVVFIPRYYPDGSPLKLVKYSLLEVRPGMTNSEYTVKYDIASIETDTFNPVYWECTVTPHRVQVDFDESEEGVQASKPGSMSTDNLYLNYKKVIK